MGLRLSGERCRYDAGVIVEWANQWMLIQERQCRLDDCGLPGDQGAQAAEPEFPMGQGRAARALDVLARMFLRERDQPHQHSRAFDAAGREHGL
jgi:hypothetical protein